MAGKFTSLPDADGVDEVIDPRPPPPPRHGPQRHLHHMPPPSRNMMVDRLATVEVQLIMQHCDLPTLLALARCSRFTLAAAPHPFAWRSLSPLHFSFSSATAALGAQLRGSRLLSHCDVSLRWEPANCYSHRIPPVTSAELAALESVPRLVALDARRRIFDSPASTRRLLAHPALGNLTALHTSSGQLNGRNAALLPVHQPRLRALTLQPRGLFDDADHRDFLAPLPLLHSLTELSLCSFKMDAECTASLAACTSLRRLHFWGISLQALCSVLTAPSFPLLESLSLVKVAGSGSDAAGVSTDVKTWTTILVSQCALRFFRLLSCDNISAALEGAAAAITTSKALRNLTALIIDTLRMDNGDGSLLPLLAAHCPQLRQLQMDISSDDWTDRAAPAARPLLACLTDLHLDSIQARCQMIRECTSLRRLHLTNADPEVLHALLCAPHLQRLETLTLESVQLRFGIETPLDWSLCIANLRSMHTLHLLQLYYGSLLLGAIPAAAPAASSSLRRITLRHSPWEEEIAVETMGAALRHLPLLVLEMRSSFVLGDEWTKLRGLYPDRALTADPPSKDPFAFWTD